MNCFSKYIFPLLIIAVPSCTEAEVEDVVSAKEIEYDFSIVGTKTGSASSTTYRALLHSAYGNAGIYPYLNISGSYRGPAVDERAWLTACEVNPNTGEWVADSHKYGLRAPNEKYFISFVSPAVAPQQYKWNSSTNSYDEWGFFHSRQPQSDEPELFISTPKLINPLNGNHIEGKYVYDVPDDVVLREMRAKVSLKVKCGDDLASATVKKIGWTHLYESCYYNLRLDELDSFNLMASTDTIPVYTPDAPLTLNRGDDAVEVFSDFFLFPLNYPQKDEHDQYVYEAPELDFYVARGLAPMKVYHKMEPQYTYTYTVTINSAFISVDFSSVSWDETGTQTGSVDANPGYTARFDIIGWDEHEDKGTIE